MKKYDNGKVAPTLEKMRENPLDGLVNVQRTPFSAPVRNGDDISFNQSRGRRMSKLIRTLAIRKDIKDYGL